jgi:hypothetical protein
MADDRFDPAGYLAFDLAHGTIGAARAGTPAVVVPREALVALSEEPGMLGFAALARAIGRWIAAALRERLGGAAAAHGAAPEAFLTALNGVLAVHGLGRLALETYGDVLLVRVESSPLAGPPGERFFEELLASLLGDFLGRPVQCLALPDADEPCILVGGPQAVRRAGDWRKEGASPEAIAARLHRESRAARKVSA